MANLTTRYTDASGFGILLDVLLLSKSQYLVCTHSSNVCRMAYEMMQARDVNSVSQVKSLDQRYFFYGQVRNLYDQKKDYYEGVIAHKATNTNEISFNVGDLISIKPCIDRCYHENPCMYSKYIVSLHRVD